MTRYQEAGYNALTLFMVVKDGSGRFRTGEICWLAEDDGGFAPYFSSLDVTKKALVTTSEIAELAKDEDGFYEWGGGECPVPGDWWVEVKLRRGGSLQRNMAHGLRWDHDLSGYGPSFGDIVAFKPISRPDVTSCFDPGEPNYLDDEPRPEQNEPGNPTAFGIEEGYEKLAAALQGALDQAQGGKGSERHAQGQPFHEQPMQRISQLIGSRDGMAFQAIKKIQESQRFEDTHRVINELRGAINYVAGMIIYLEEKEANNDS